MASKAGVSSLRCAKAAVSFSTGVAGGISGSISNAKWLQIRENIDSISSLPTWPPRWKRSLLSDPGDSSLPLFSCVMSRTASWSLSTRMSSRASASVSSTSWNTSLSFELKRSSRTSFSMVYEVLSDCCSLARRSRWSDVREASSSAINFLRRCLVEVFRFLESLRKRNSLEQGLSSSRNTGSLDGTWIPSALRPSGTERPVVCVALGFLRYKLDSDFVMFLDTTLEEWSFSCRLSLESCGLLRLMFLISESTLASVWSNGVPVWFAADSRTVIVKTDTGDLELMAVSDFTFPTFLLGTPGGCIKVSGLLFSPGRRTCNCCATFTTACSTKILANGVTWDLTLESALLLLWLRWNTWFFRPKRVMSAVWARVFPGFIRTSSRVMRISVANKDANLLGVEPVVTVAFDKVGVALHSSLFETWRIKSLWEMGICRGFTSNLPRGKWNPMTLRSKSKHSPRLFLTRSWKEGHSFWEDKPVFARNPWTNEVDFFQLLAFFFHWHCG